MQRPCLFVTLLFASGLLLGRGLPPLPMLFFFATLFLVVLSITSYLKRLPHTHFFILASILIVGIASESLVVLSDKHSLETIESLSEDKPVTATGKAGYCSIRKSKTILDIGSVVIEKDGEKYLIPSKLRIVLTGSAKEKFDSAGVVRGDDVRLNRLQIHPVSSRSNPDVFDYKSYLASQGISGIAKCWTAQRIEFNPLEKRRGIIGMFLAYTGKIRQGLTARIDASLDAKSAGVLKAILLGETHFLSPREKELFIDTGVMHLFAVSGLHVGLIWYLFQLMFTVLRIPYRANAYLCMFVLVIYMALTGFRPSVIRATIMLECLLAARVVRYEVESITCLCFAALVILLFNPRAIGQASFQLSFIAMFSIILFFPLLREMLAIKKTTRNRRSHPLIGKVNAYLIEPFSLLVSINIGMLPLLLHYYHRFCLIGFISNLVIVPLGCFAVASALMGLCVGLIWVSLGSVIFVATSFATSLMTNLAGMFDSIPYSVIPSQSMPWVLIGLYYLILLQGYWVRKPRDEVDKVKQRASFAIRLVIAFTLVVWFPLIGVSRGTITAYFLDIGDADAIYIEFPDGKNMLVDGGGNSEGRYVVGPFLRARGASFINTVVATHSHSDHVGGLTYVLESFFVDSVIEGGSTSSTKIYSKFQSLLEEQDVEHRLVKKGDRFEGINGVDIFVLSPDERDIASNSTNNNSIVLRIVFDEFSMLLTGDIEKKSEQRLVSSGDELDSDILKAPHHGSASSSTLEFLKAVNPKVVVISVGKRHHLPALAVIDRYNNLNYTIFRTDENGAITVSSDGKSIDIQTEK